MSHHPKAPSHDQYLDDRKGIALAGVLLAVFAFGIALIVSGLSR